MLMLFDRDESFIASLKYKNVVRKREINGLNTLEFETNKEVEFGQRLLFKDRQGLWHEYIIIDYFKSHNEDGLTYEVYCEDNTSELYGHYIDDLKPREETAISILRRILGGARFEPGYVDDFGKRSFNLYRTNVKAALWKILEEYGAEIQVRLDVGKDGIKHRYIDLKRSIGRDAGKRFTYKKDMGSIKKTTSIKDLVTALYGYGKGEEIVGEDGQPSGGYGRKIDFAELNNGKKYVEDEEARKKYGTGPERKHIFGIADFDDCEDRAELLELTKAKLKELSKPKISYELSVEDISRYEGFEGEAVDLGDTVTVIDDEINTRVQTRIIAIKDNPLEEVEDSEITLGNFIKDLSSSMVEYDQLKSSFENNRNKFNDELKKLAEGVKTSYMQKVLEKFNQELNETGGWVYAEEGEGLLILNAPKDGNPTQAINLKGGKIAIANHKNPDGSFAYETFGDGDGFTANLIRTGILKGEKVHFDLNNGTFLIGNNSNDYTMYWDGSVLHLRNVDIDLSNNQQITNIENSITNQAKEIGDVRTNINNQKEQILSMKNDFKLDLDGIKTSFEKRVKGVESDVGIRDGNIRSYIETNYSSKIQTSNLIESKVSSINTRLGSAESSIRQTANELSKKVSKNGIISEINQSPESVKIKASKINLDGDLTLSGRFTSKNNGGYNLIDIVQSKIKVYDPGDLYDYYRDNQTGYISGVGFQYNRYGTIGYGEGISINHTNGKLISLGKDLLPSDYGETSKIHSLDELKNRLYMTMDIDENFRETNKGYPITIYQNTYLKGDLMLQGWNNIYFGKDEYLRFSTSEVIFYIEASPRIYRKFIIDTYSKRLYFEDEDGSRTYV